LLKDYLGTALRDQPASVTVSSPTRASGVGRSAGTGDLTPVGRREALRSGDGSFMTDLTPQRGHESGKIRLGAHLTLQPAGPPANGIRATAESPARGSASGSRAARSATARPRAGGIQPGANRSAAGDDFAAGHWPRRLGGEPAGGGQMPDACRGPGFIDRPPLPPPSWPPSRLASIKRGVPDTQGSSRHPGVPDTHTPGSSTEFQTPRSSRGVPDTQEFQTPIRQREMHSCSAHPSLDRHAPPRSCCKRSSRRKAPAIPFGDGWVSGTPIRRRERTRVPTALAASPWPCSRQGEMNGGCLPFPCDFLAAFSPRFVSLGDTLERLRFVPVRPQTHSRGIIPEFALPVAPDPVFFRELSGSPTFP
jgi:hypothetical protein